MTKSESSPSPAAKALDELPSSRRGEALQGYERFTGTAHQAADYAVAMWSLDPGTTWRDFESVRELRDRALIRLMSRETVMKLRALSNRRAVPIEEILTDLVEAAHAADWSAATGIKNSPALPEPGVDSSCN